MTSNIYFLPFLSISFLFVFGILLTWLFIKNKHAAHCSNQIVEKESIINSLKTTILNNNQELERLKTNLQQSDFKNNEFSCKFNVLARKHAVALSKLEQVDSLKKQISNGNVEINKLQDNILELKKNQVKLETLLEKERSSHKDKSDIIEYLKSNLKDSFNSISTNALSENNQTFIELAQTTLSKYFDIAKKDFDFKNNDMISIIQPIKEALEKYDNYVKTIEISREKAYEGLSQKIISISNTQLGLEKETRKLVKALRLPHVRGRWGEITLKRVAELSGMSNQCDFFEQPTISTGHLTIRPDMIVKLPYNRHVIVDAKVPLSAYLDSLEAENDHERDLLLENHSKQVKHHVLKLSKKSYWDSLTTSPEFVVLFIPGENFFSAALLKSPKLIEEASEKGVIIATPTTLISLLKTISYGWKQETTAQNAKEISIVGHELYERIFSMVKHINKLGHDLERSSESYNQLAGSFERRVSVSARKFRDLGLSLKGEDSLPFTKSIEKKFKTINN